MKFDHFDITARARKKYTFALEPVCRQWDLTKNELDVLLFLHNNPEYDRAADIVAHRGMAKSHVSLSVTNLERRGLLRRSEDPEDRRAVHLKLTDEARVIAEAGKECQVHFFSAMFDGLSREDVVFWQSLMDRVCDNIDHMDG